MANCVAGVTTTMRWHLSSHAKSLRANECLLYTECAFFWQHTRLVCTHRIEDHSDNRSSASWRASFKAAASTWRITTRSFVKIVFSIHASRFLSSISFVRGRQAGEVLPFSSLQLSRIPFGVTVAGDPTPFRSGKFAIKEPIPRHPIV